MADTTLDVLNQTQIELLQKYDGALNRFNEINNYFEDGKAIEAINALKLDGKQATDFALLNGDSTQRFKVANAVENSEAVNRGQSLELIESYVLDNGIYIIQNYGFIENFTDPTLSQSNDDIPVGWSIWLGAGYVDSKEVIELTDEDKSQIASIGSIDFISPDKPKQSFYKWHLILTEDGANLTNLDACRIGLGYAYCFSITPDSRRVESSCFYRYKKDGEWSDWVYKTGLNMDFDDNKALCVKIGGNEEVEIALPFVGQIPRASNGNNTHLVGRRA